MQVSWEAVQQGQLLVRGQKRAASTGVYVGIQQMEYGSLAMAHSPGKRLLLGWEQRVGMAAD